MESRLDLGHPSYSDHALNSGDSREGVRIIIPQSPETHNSHSKVQQAAPRFDRSNRERLAQERQSTRFLMDA